MFNLLISRIKEINHRPSSSIRIRRLRRCRSRFAFALIDFLQAGSIRESIAIRIKEVRKRRKTKELVNEREDLLFGLCAEIQLRLALGFVMLGVEDGQDYCTVN